ncbi:MAG: hypothetical protein RR758_05180, partial [Burkholderiaceae bacterium]
LSGGCAAGCGSGADFKRLYHSRCGKDGVAGCARKPGLTWRKNKTKAADGSAYGFVAECAENR